MEKFRRLSVSLVFKVRSEETGLVLDSFRLVFGRYQDGFEQERVHQACVKPQRPDGGGSDVVMRRSSEDRGQARGLMDGMDEV